MLILQGNSLNAKQGKINEFMNNRLILKLSQKTIDFFAILLYNVGNALKKPFVSAVIKQMFGK